MENAYAKKTAGRGNALGRKFQGRIAGVLALTIVLALAASFGIMDMMERRAHYAAEKLVSEVVEHIDGKMNEVKDKTREEAEAAYEQLYSPEALEKLVYDFVEQNAFVLGSTVAFEPDVFPERGRCFAPYSWKSADGEVHSRQLGTETDYYQEEWYAETKLSGEEYWCEPYFDEGGAKIMMCTFSVPLKDENGNLVAVMTADVGLEDLKEYISSISPYPDSYIVLRSAMGSTLVNEELDSAGGNDTIIKGRTETGWTVELMLPFTYLLHRDSGIYFFIGAVFLITILIVYFINRLLTGMQQRSSEEYLNVIDAISSGYSSICLVDLLTNQTVAFRDPVNYEQVLGAPSEENSNFTARMTRLIEYDCCPADRAMMLKEVTPLAIRKGLANQDRYEVRFRKEAEGAFCWYEMQVFIMERDKEGAPERAVIAFKDVNESVQHEKETQDALEQAVCTAESANKAKTDFLFNMSHDIRTPMNAIIGFTNMAKKHIGDDEKVLDCLNKTQQSSSLLLALINSVLDVSRIEAGQAKLDEKAADVNLSFTAIEDTLTELAAARDISLSFEIEQVKNRYVYCDLDRCNRIFVNIISNAIKYTNEGGFVKVKCEQIPCEWEGYGLYRYTFEDSGIGMSEEFQKKVFEQFTREKTSTVSGIQGSGLGLAVCKSFTELMGGTIECKSRLGKGTTFTVTLPFRLQSSRRYINPFTREEVDAYEGKDAIAPVSLKGRKVLLVEDNELNREIAEDILADEEMEVETAENGSIAVDIMREKGPEYFDFVLMDIQMPVMDGYEATRAIREMYPAAKIPIIAVSANAFAEDKASSLAAGMNDHVAKPVDISKLKETLAKYLQS